VNNHIHTIYSFSPYSPAMAALKASEAGLLAAGSVDHDSAEAAKELKAACALLGIGGCSGFEIRVTLARFADRKINNPDSPGNAYITVQGIPSQSLEKCAAFLKPIREARLERSRKMADAASGILRDAGLSPINFDSDIVNESQYRNGGEITERHLCAAVAAKCIASFGKGSGLVEGLKKKFNLEVSKKIAAYLSDAANPHYQYDLLGVLKTGFLPRIFIQPGGTECVSAKEAASFAVSVGAIPAYSYLGDVGESPTGDKKAEKFEDDFLPELFQEIKAAGFRAITYMPPRNTPAQLETIQRYCREGNYMEISGVDINSSRQSFNCPEVLRENCKHLVDTTWALVAHECLASLDYSLGLFSPSNPLASLPLTERLAIYADAGKALDKKHPAESAEELKINIETGSKK
jgi:predicted metal-dependent phosphoesterase TrpH